MQTTMASSICPLCKSPVGADATSNPLPSRLCDPCRAMLATILPQAVAGSVVIVDAQKPSSQAQVAAPQIAFAETHQEPLANQSAMEFEAHVQAAETSQEPTLQADAQGNADLTSFHSSATSSAEPVYFDTEEKLAPPPSQVAEASETFFIQAEDKLEDPYSQAEEQFADQHAQTEENVEPHYVQAEVVEEHTVPAEEKSPYSFREAEFVSPPQTNAPVVEQLEKEAERPSPGGNFFVAPEANQFVVQEPWQTQEAAPFQTQEAEPLYPSEVESQPVYPQAVAPLYLQEPVYQTGQPVTGDLPLVWDDSMDNYPVLMVQEEKRSLLKPMMAIAAMALIALAAAGYWFVYKPFFSDTTPNATQRAGANVEDSKPAAQPTIPEKIPENRSPAPQQETPANASTAPTTPATPEDKPATPEDVKPNLEGQNGQGKYSLQAASFPSQQAANEFSEKLIRSGVPAYIASANIAGKGQWFRVRVGRFANAAEAEKYAAQAKQRAKATGLNLALVVCDYTNP
jgi:hypothetical protein